jgi:transcriptional regulator with XRE-family HTH domain
MRSNLIVSTVIISPWTVILDKVSRASHSGRVANIEPFYRDLGRRIQAARDRANLTQQEVAERLLPKMTRAAVANMESGKQRVLCHTLVALSDVLRVSPTELLIAAAGERPPVPSTEIEAEIRRKLKLGKRAAQTIMGKLEGERS